MKKADIGLIGLATMGKNLARNIADKGFSVSVYNRTAKKTAEFIKEFGGKNLLGAKTLKELAENLERPRKIILLVKAGEAVDEVIKDLQPKLAKGDMILDLGNSHYCDTTQRAKNLSKKGIYFIGCGISGGEEGALHGPCLMPGGEFQAYKEVQEIFVSIAAQDSNNGKCVSYIGRNPTGHFVKMIHNGIEYGLMQVIAESYDLLKNLGHFTNRQIAEIFTAWTKYPFLNSFLIEITSKILARKDNIIDLIKDTAEQKGTGKWTTQAAHNLGIPIPTINAAVDARIISGSSIRKIKNRLPKHFIKTTTPKNLKQLIQNSLECSFICTYNQGLSLLRKAGEEYSWNLNLSEIARIWQGGCIIRSSQLKLWQKAFSRNSKKASQKIISTFNKKRQQNWRKLVSLAANSGIPVPAISSSLTYYDSIIAGRLPQNLISAQRDFFGAHGYQRTDKKGSFHIEW